MYSQPTAIGAPVTRIEGPEKVTGKTRFAADVILPGMLWGKILRSPYPHARIRRIDASAAWRVPGVKAVVTPVKTPLATTLERSFGTCLSSAGTGFAI